MTTPATEAKAGPYDGNDSASVFAFDFPVYADSDIRVIETLISTEAETDLVLNGANGYTVVRNIDQDNNPGGEITYKQAGITAALPSTKQLTIVSDFAFEQPTDIPNGGSFFASIIERAFDRVTMLVKQLKEQVDRSVKVPVSSDTDPDDLVADLIAASDAAVAAYDAFDDRYLGSHASDPTTDNDGDALVEGALYWNTADNVMKVYNGATWQALASATYIVTNATGDGVETEFPLPVAPISSNNVDVFFDGVYQSKSSYTVSGLDLTFSTAPPNGVDVEFVITQTLPVNSADAANVTFTPAGAGALQTNAQAKFREIVSVKDFGAVGDGVTDDADAINTAEAAASAGGRSLYFPAGTYLCASPLYRLGNTDWVGEGMYSSIIKHSGGAATHHLVTVQSLSSEYSHVGFYGLGFDGNRTGASNPSAARNIVYIDRDADGGDSSPSDDFRFIGCRIFNFSYGGKGLHVKGYTGLQIKDSYFADGGGGLEHPIYIRRCADVVVTGNTAIGQDGNICIKIQSSPQTTIANNVTRGGDRGIVAQDATNYSITGNTVTAATTEGISVTIEDLSSSSNVSITGNSVASSATAIGVSNAVFVAIVGNTGTAFTTNGIRIRSVQDSTISGNVLRTSDNSIATCNFINFDAGPTASRCNCKGNWLRNARSGGTTNAIYSNEASIGALDVAGNSFSGTWTARFSGVISVTHFEQMSSAPSSPDRGDTYYDLGTDKLRTWNGATWNNLF